MTEMSEMIDRAAQAMFDALMIPNGAYAYGDSPSDITLDGSFDLRELARIAVEAALAPDAALTQKRPAREQ